MTKPIRYEDCPVCSQWAKPYFDNDECEDCLKRRITEVEYQRDTLVAALRPFAECAPFYDHLYTRGRTMMPLRGFVNTYLVEAGRLNPVDHIKAYHILAAADALRRLEEVKHE